MAPLGKSRNRRNFLKASASTAAAAVALPTIIPSSAIGRDGATPPSERIVVGGIGIGNRGTYDLGCFLEQSDVQFAAVCDIKEATSLGGQENGRREARQSELRHDSRLSRTARSQRHRRRADRHRSQLALHDGHRCSAGRQGHVLRKALHEEHCPKSGAGRYHASHRRAFSKLARNVAICPTSPLPATWRARASLANSRRSTPTRPACRRSRAVGCRPSLHRTKEVIDWDTYLGPAAWRPFNPQLLNGFNFEKGGGLVGGGVLEWGSHCVDLCQWAMGDCPPPIEYNAKQNDELVATYANGVQLIFREKGWIPLGSCPVRFEGETGWVEAGDSGKMVLSSPELLAGRTVEEVDGYPATFHVRDFLDCVKTRSQPKGNPEAAARAHIACHAANVALFLDRQVNLDTDKMEFIDDAEANRLRSEALREPYRI